MSLGRRNESWPFLRSRESVYLLVWQSRLMDFVSRQICPGLWVRVRIGRHTRGTPDDGPPSRQIRQNTDPQSVVIVERRAAVDQFIDWLDL